jgi:hypothetical protein
MPNLSIPEITKDGKEYRSVLLVEKTFQKNGKTNVFKTDGGLFHAKYILIGTTKITKSSDVDKTAGEILSLRLKKGLDRILKIGGTYVGSKSNTEIPITQFEKSEEFGGMPAGGTRVNKGLLFETDLAKRLDEYVEGRQGKGQYASETSKIIEMCSAKIGSPVVNFRHEGGANTSRPIVNSGSQVFVSPKDHREHGSKLTDITLVHHNKKESYLSLKYSSTLTFVNSGVSKIFPETEIKKGSISSPVGKAIMSAFGIEELSFCNVFNDYGKGTRHATGVNVSSKIDRNALKLFLSTAIGSDYWMIHGMDGGKIWSWYMDPSKNNTMSTVSGPIIIDYGGSSGTGKRVNISFSNSFFDFTVNIRNKQSGRYPSHIMCDYKSKPATGKKLL